MAELRERLVEARLASMNVGYTEEDIIERVVEKVAAWLRDEATTIRRHADYVFDPVKPLVAAELERLARSLDSELTTDPRPSLVSPCPVCGFADWPEGGMHAAKSIHLLAHERARDFDVEQTKEQEET